MNILCIGGWLTGNSAILDYLDGSDDISYIRSDFDLFRQENGIYDLVNETNEFKKPKIEWTLCILTLNELYRSIRVSVGLYTKYLYKGRKYRENELNFRRYNASILFNIYFLLKLNGYIMGRRIKKNFNEVDYWGRWIKNAAYLMNKKKTKFCLYCNPVYANNLNISSNSTWWKIFTPFKVICVYRNPHDQLSDILKINGHLQTEPIRFFGNTNNDTPAERVLKVLKSIHRMRIDLSQNLTSDQLLILSFDDFISHNELVKNKINSFLGIDENNYINETNSKFNLELSKKNLGIGATDKKLQNFMNENTDFINEIVDMYKETKALKQTFIL